MFSTVSSTARVVAPFLLVAALIAAPPSSVAQSQSLESRMSIERTISVTGHGSISVEPDAVSISIGVTSEGDTAGAALAENSQAMNKAVETIKAAGVAAKDIQTSNFNINPRYAQPRQGQAARINGYVVNNTVRIVLRDVKRLGTLLDEVTKAGSNQVSGIVFQVSKAEEHRNAARKAAVADARAKAELYAAAAGVRLGKVLVIEDGAAPPRPVPVARGRAMAAEAMAAPIEAGSQALDAVVSVTWSLE
jgi:hypothetical protein